MKAQPLQAIAGFAALLREHGLTVGIAEQQAMVRAALALPTGQPQRVSTAWRAIACHDVRDWQRWPELLERYWRPEKLRGSTKISGQTRASHGLQQLVQSLHDSMAPGGLRAAPAAPADSAPHSAAQHNDPGLQRAQGGASRTEALEDRSFSLWLPQDLALLERLAQRIAQKLQQRLTRRWQSARTGARLDIRRTLRASLATGGVPLAPVWRRPRREHVRLFLLIDVSRSMQTHAQLFLRIARALVRVSQARVFVFHTRLAEVTGLLKRDTATVQEKINAVTAGFGGGTRIASAIDDFRTLQARAQLGHRARVWLLSDGFDADPAPALAKSLAALHALGPRIDWVHPSVHTPNSQALARVRQQPGLIAEFHRLDSLSDLERLAAQLH